MPPFCGAAKWLANYFRPYFVDRKGGLKWGYSSVMGPVMGVLSCKRSACKLDWLFLAVVYPLDGTAA